MKLNPDCVRDILMTFEELCTDVDKTYIFSSFDEIPMKLPKLNKYPAEVLAYHIRQLDLSGMLFDAKFNRDGFSFADITPRAHEFLANIRENKIWNGVKVIETEKLTKMKLSLNELKYNISCYLRERIKRFGTDFLSNDFYAVPYFIFANISEKFMSPWSDIRK